MKPCRLCHRKRMILEGSFVCDGCDRELGPRAYGIGEIEGKHTPVIEVIGRVERSYHGSGEVE